MRLFSHSFYFFIYIIIYQSNFAEKRRTSDINVREPLRYDEWDEMELRGKRSVYVILEHCREANEFQSRFYCEIFIFFHNSLAMIMTNTTIISQSALISLLEASGSSALTSSLTFFAAFSLYTSSAKNILYSP